jgi:hypothetical protein
MQIFDGETPDPSTGRKDDQVADKPKAGTVTIHRHFDCGNWEPNSNLKPFRTLSTQHDFAKVVRLRAQRTRSTSHARFSSLVELVPCALIR